MATKDAMSSPGLMACRGGRRMLDKGKMVIATDYLDFNAPITIELPKCN